MTIFPSSNRCITCSRLKDSRFARLIKPEDFLAHAGTHHVPVLVTDIWMDGVTGLEVLARLCAISPRTRVIVITAREDLAARATAMAIGPVAFFMKPFDDEKFIAAVRDALAQVGTG